MSAKKGFGIGGMKSGFGRMKQKALSSMGKSDTTVDVQFEQEKKRFEAQLKALKALRKQTQAYQKALRDLAVAHSKMTTHIHGLYDASCPLWNACLAQEKVTNDIDNLRNELEELWQRNFYEPFGHHLAQYKVISERIEERERRLVDMDRYRYDVKKLLEKNTPGAQAKVQMAREKAEGMTRAYQELNEELLRDMPTLVEDRFGFFDPLFATIVDGQAQYFGRSAESFQNLTAYFDGVDRTGSHDRPRVITDSEQSAYSAPIYLPGQVVGRNTVENDHRTPGSVSLADAGLTDVGQKSRGEGFVSGAGTRGLGATPSPGTSPAYGGGVPPPSSGGAYGAPPPGGNVYGAPPPGAQPPQQYPQASAPPMGASAPRALPVAGGPRGRGMRGRGRGMRGRGGGAAGMPVPVPGGGPPPAAAGKVRAKALYPFEAQDPTELGFAFGEFLIVLKQEGEWWEAQSENTGQIGLVPASYISIV